MAVFDILKRGLEKTRKGILEKFEGILASFGIINEDLFEELEEILITSDVGVETALEIVENIRNSVKKNKVTDPGLIKNLLKEELINILKDENTEPISDKGPLLKLNTFPTVIIVIGVNGVGKTTTIGKIASDLRNNGKKVVIAAGDTFRAAAIEQLEIWAKRARAELIKHFEGSDPSAVIYDAIQAAKARKADVLICDTAGRLHTKKNLMEELRKIYRTVNRNFPEAKLETLLVLDATTGQNAISQAKIFNEVANVTGIALTKLDGTAKGGIIVAIKSEMGIPIKLIGVGERIEDLQPFDPTAFVDALF